MKRPRLVPQSNKPVDVDSAAELQRSVAAFSQEAALRRQAVDSAYKALNPTGHSFEELLLHEINDIKARLDRAGI